MNTDLSRFLKGLSGTELLWIAATSNSAMRARVESELELRTRAQRTKLAARSRRSPSVLHALAQRT